MTPPNSEREKMDAAFEMVRAYLEDGTYAEHAKEIDAALTTIQDEMKRLQEERDVQHAWAVDYKAQRDSLTDQLEKAKAERDAALQLVDDTVATLEATAE